MSANTVTDVTALAGVRCPYPGCSNRLNLKNSSDVCGCEFVNQLVSCPSCSCSNVAHARFCRACQRGLPEIGSRRSVQFAPVDFLLLKGEFHFPAVSCDGFYWCLSAEGIVYRLSARSKAKPKEWARVRSGMVGYNRASIVNVVDSGLPVKGPLLLTADPNAVYGVSLVNGAIFPLWEASRGEILANSTPRESISFRGVAASDGMFSFLYRAEGGQGATLAIRYFRKDQASEDPITVSGNQFMAPIIYHQRSTGHDFIAVCSDEEIWIYGLHDKSVTSFTVPDRVKLIFSRSYQVNVPPGCVPFAIGRGPNGWEAWVAGLEDERPGIFHAWLETQRAGEFISIPDGACVGNAWPNGLFVNRGSRAEFLGMSGTGDVISDLQPGMPLGYQAGNCVYFNTSPVKGQHMLTAFGSALPGGPFRLNFEDALCDAASCCSVVLSDQEVVVNYVNRTQSSPERGLKLAFWRVVA